MLDDPTLDRLFRTARSTHAFDSQPVTDETVHALYELLKWGPTSFNSQPGRYLFLRSPQARERLLPALSNSNREKTRKAPMTVIVAYDERFHERIPELSPGSSGAAQLAANPQLAHTTALRNGSLQGAYLMIAARALGLAAGPMSGFDAQKVDGEFFAECAWRANFLVNLGYADGSAIKPRAPRLPFEQAARIL